MKHELFEYTPEEAKAFLDSEGSREIDYVETDGYKLFGNGLTDLVKLRHYEDNSYMLQIDVPEEMQCVPCDIKFKTEKLDECPACKTTTRDIMLRNKVHEEPFRRFEGVATRLMYAFLKVAQPLCAYTADNFSEEQALEAYNAGKLEYDMVLDEIKAFNWVFSDGIMEKIKAMKSKDINVKVMKDLMGDDSSEESLLDFSK